MNALILAVMSAYMANLSLIMRDIVMVAFIVDGYLFFSPGNVSQI